MTSAAFDPYHKWLGIPPSEQPPNLYRLLGVTVFESDPDVISYAADQRMSLLRSIAAGPHSALSQRLLNEIAAAKVTLLKPEKKQVYDAELRTKLLPPAAPPADFPLTAAAGTTIPTFAAPVSAATARLRRAPRARSRGPLMWVGFALVSCAVIVGLLYALNQQGQGPPQAKRDTAKEETKPDSPDTTTGLTELGKGKESVKQEVEGKKSDTPGIDKANGEAPEPESPSEKSAKKRGRLKKTNQKQPAVGADPSVSQPAVPETPTAKSLPDLPRPIITNPPATASKRVIIPAADDLARAEKAIDDLLKSDFAKAKTNPLKVELAKRLFELAKGTRDDAAAEYVQLRRGIDLAAEAGQNDLAWEIIDTLAERFDVDELAEKERSLATAGRLVKNAQDYHALAETWVVLTREAIERDDYELATRTANEARRTARLSTDAVFIKIVERGTENLQQLKEAYADVKPAKDQLAVDPTDAEAAANWGRFLCAYKNDWRAGLSLWEKTSDGQIADLIRRDLANPAENEARVRLGDDWFAASERETENLPRLFLKTRAAYWYKEALPNLTGLTKARVEKRVEEVYEATSPFVRGQIVNVLGLVHPKRHALRGEWGRRGNQIGLVKPISHGWFYIPVAVKGDFDLIVEFRRDKDTADWTNVILPIGGGWVRFHLVLGEKPRVLFGNLPPDKNKAPAISTRLVSGGRHRIQFSVRHVGDSSRVSAEINNRAALIFDAAIQAHHGAWMVEGGAKAPTGAIGLETADNTLIYESALLRMISGTAELLP